ncbi:MAG: tetratricopeptide repeat protein [Chitinophagaceae bacterium]
MPDQNEIDSLVSKAVDLNNNSKFKETIALLTDELLLKYNSAALYTERADAHNGLQEYADQKHFLDKAIVIDPGYYKIYNSRGNWLAAKQDWPKALDDYNKTIALNPSYDDVFYNKGFALFNINDNLGAIREYTSFIKMKPGIAEAYNVLGLAYFNNKEYDKAIENFDQAIQLKPDNPIYYFNKGSSWYNKNDLNKAIREYDMAIKKDPQKPLAYNNRGLAYYSKSDYAAAIENYNTAIQLGSDTNTFIVYDNLGMALYKINEFDAAIKNFDKAIELNKKDHIVYDNRGRAWFSKGDTEKAIADYSTAIALDESFAEAYKDRGKARERQGSPEAISAAIDDYQKAIELDKGLDTLRVDIDFLKLQIGQKPATSEIASFIFDVSGKIADEQKRDLVRKSASRFYLNVDAIKKHTQIHPSCRVVHYTKLWVADKLVVDPETHLRYSNVTNMNDPEEGKVLRDVLIGGEGTDKIKAYFDRTKLFTNGDYSDSNVYLGSFLPAPDRKKDTHEDELVMWRTYGKDENMNEASGCSIVIDVDFFYWRTPDSRPRLFDPFLTKEKKVYEQTETSSQTTQSGVKSTDNSNEDQELYRVLYYNNIQGKIEDKADFVSAQLNEDIRTLKIIMNQLIDQRENDTDKQIDEIISRGLSELRYFFKSANYAFENEYRVIQYCVPKSRLVKFDETQKTIPRVLYVESAKPLKPYIKKIYLGPKVSHPERWMYLEVALNRHRTGEDVKVVTSSCKFQ